MFIAHALQNLQAPWKSRRQPSPVNVCTLEATWKLRNDGAMAIAWPKRWKMDNSVFLAVFCIIIIWHQNIYPNPKHVWVFFASQIDLYKLFELLCKKKRWFETNFWWFDNTNCFFKSSQVIIFEEPVGHHPQNQRALGGLQTHLEQRRGAQKEYSWMVNEYKKVQYSVNIYNYNKLYDDV